MTPLRMGPERVLLVDDPSSLGPPDHTCRRTGKGRGWSRELLLGEGLLTSEGTAPRHRRSLRRLPSGTDRGYESTSLAPPPLHQGWTDGVAGISSPR